MPPRSVDDVITLAIQAIGTEVPAAPLEDVIRSSQLVRDVVLFGQGRKQLGVLIEPSQAIDVNDKEAVATFKNQIRANIEEANSLSPVAFGGITQETILITKNDKPLTREGGTVQPEASLGDYEVEINNLYDRPSFWTRRDIGQWLLRHARAIRPDTDINTQADLFSRGFHSIEAARLREKILNALKHWRNATQDDVPHNLIYQIPIIQTLSLWIATLANEGPQQARALINQQEQAAIGAMIEAHSISPPREIPAAAQIGDGAVVLLTGSTGGLGSSLLCKLLQSDRVARVITFNRHGQGAIKDRHQESLQQRGLPLDVLDSDKLQYVLADASQVMLGLDEEDYNEIRNSVTLIIHAAWPVDFNLGLSSFEDTIRALRNLVDLALDSPNRQNLRFLFTSSIASAPNNAQEPFPEEVLPRPPVSFGTGYGASKYVAERIIATSGLSATSFRIGQIAGANNGCWARTNWFPSLVISGRALGRLPRGNGVVSWLSEEYVASAILDTAFGETLPSALNLVNHQSQSFAGVIELVRNAITGNHGQAAQDALPIIDSDEWLQLLQERANDPDNLRQFPAIKLLEFIGSALHAEDNEEVAGIKCAVARMREVSPTVAGPTWQIGAAQAAAWVQYWHL